MSEEFDRKKAGTREVLKITKKCFERVYRDISDQEIVVESCKDVCFDNEEFFNLLEEIRLFKRRMVNAIGSLDIILDDLQGVK